MHEEIIELVKKVLTETDPNKLAPMLKVLRKRLAEEQQRIQSLIAKREEHPLRNTKE